MAKIDIYENENDVMRESLRSDARSARKLSFLGFELGTVFSVTGLLQHISEKTGIADKMRNTTLAKKLDFFPSLTKAINKHIVAASLAIGGTFLVMGVASLFKAKSLEKKLEALDPGEPQQVIVPDNLSSSALSEIPIRPMDEQKLHKVPAESLKNHTQRLLQDIGVEQAKSL